MKVSRKYMLTLRKNRQRADERLRRNVVYDFTDNGQRYFIAKVRYWYYAYTVGRRGYLEPLQPVIQTATARAAMKTLLERIG